MAGRPHIMPAVRATHLFLILIETIGHLYADGKLFKAFDNWPITTAGPQLRDLMTRGIDKQNKLLICGTACPSIR